MSNTKNGPVEGQQTTKDALRRRYRIKWPPGLPEIPPPDQFKLSSILASPEVDQAASECVEALLEVTMNYKKDLKTEIRRNLSREQRIQNVNILVSQLSRRLNKVANSSNKSLHRAATGAQTTLSQIDEELGLLSRLLSENSLLASLLIVKCATLEARVDALDLYDESSSNGQKNGSLNSTKTDVRQDIVSGKGDGSFLLSDGTERPMTDSEVNSGVIPRHIAKKYPTVAQVHSKLLRGSQVAQIEAIGAASSSKMSISSLGTENIITQATIDSQAGPDLQESITREIEEENAQPYNNSTNGKLPENFSKETANVAGNGPNSGLNGSKRHCKEQGAVFVEPESMTTEQFEMFMTENIEKHRFLQAKHELFMQPLQELSWDGLNSPNGRAADIAAAEAEIRYEMTQNDTEFERAEAEIEGTTAALAAMAGPSFRFSIKSSPTTSSTPQLTHFKKLRINGSPITSQTFQKMKTKPLCDCLLEESTHGRPRGSDAVIKHLTEVKGPLLPVMPDYTPTGPELSLELPGSASLLLRQLEEDDWNSSGLSDSLSFELLELDTESESERNATNRYYVSLKLNLDLKKRRRHRRSTLRRLWLKRAPETLPTPKHTPLHRLLKPKNSILKQLRPSAASVQRQMEHSGGVITSSGANSRLVGRWEPSKMHIMDSSGHSPLNIGIGGPVILPFAVAATGLMADDESGSSDEFEVSLWRGDMEDASSVTRLREILASQ